MQFVSGVKPMVSRCRPLFFFWDVGRGKEPREADPKQVFVANIGAWEERFEVGDLL